MISCALCLLVVGSQGTVLLASADRSRDAGGTVKVLSSAVSLEAMVRRH